MRRSCLAAASLAALALAAPAAARSAPKGEWWETTTEATGFPGPPPAPQIEKECLPPDVDGPPPSEEDDDCTLTDVKRSGGKATWKMVCENRYRGEGELVRRGDTFTVKTVLRGPGGEVVRFTTRGKRLGGACDPEEEERREEAAGGGEPAPDDEEPPPAPPGRGR